MTALTPAEADIMDLLAANPGMTNKAIAYTRQVSIRQVNRLLTGAYRKYGVGNRTEAIIRHRERRKVPA